MSVEFKPTYLYIKRHRTTGLLYFGKTYRPKVETYRGSGQHWKNHYTKHGKDDIETLWYCLFLDAGSIREFAMMFSEQQDIVDSEAWANLIYEDGLTAGVRKGIPHSEETKQKMRGPRKPLSEETKAKMRGPRPQYKKRPPTSEETKSKLRQSANRGPRPPEIILKMSKPRGPLSEEHKLKLRGPRGPNKRTTRNVI